MSQLPDSFPHPRDEDSHGEPSNLDEVLAQILGEAEHEHTESGGLALAERNGNAQIDSELGSLAVNADRDSDGHLPSPTTADLRLFEGFSTDETIEESLEDQMLDEVLHDGGVDIVPAAERYLTPGPDDANIRKRLIHHAGLTTIGRESDQPVGTFEDALRVYRQGGAIDEDVASKIKDADPVSLALTPEEYHDLDNRLAPVPDEEAK